jgi:hypothetical protein
MSVHVQAPDAMRSLGSALQLLTTSLGSYLASAVTIIVASATTKYTSAFSCHCLYFLSPVICQIVPSCACHEYICHVLLPCDELGFLSFSCVKAIT